MRLQTIWETPDTQIAAFEFGDKKSITWEGRSCNSFPVKKADEDLLSMEPKAHLVNLRRW